MTNSTGLALHHESLFIDVNSATAQDLQQLVPGVGRVLAQRIVAYRAAHGPFRDESDLARVMGVNRRVAALLAPPADVVQPASPVTAQWLTSGPSNAVGHESAPEPSIRPTVEATQRAQDDTRSVPGAAVRVPRWRAHGWLSVGLVLLGTGVGHGLGVWLNARSIEAPRRELTGRIQAVQAEQQRADERAAADSSRWRAAVQALAALVEEQSTAQRSALDKTQQDIADLRTVTKRSDAWTDAQLQRLRSDVSSIKRHQEPQTSPAAASATNDSHRR